MPLPSPCLARWRSSICLFSALLLFGLVDSVPLRASGTFRPFPPRPPGESDIDRDRYELGRAIFTRRFQLEPQRLGASELQRRASILNQLQSILPRSIGARIQLPAFAPLVTEQQLEALIYYVEKRYNRRGNQR
ncbi:MAG: hypothetical protein ACFCU3_05150 [Verrucomicrobiales bacterium]